MSLSQKHPGKVLVPWFNLAEWKAVSALIYDTSCQNWPKALEVLKIWKLRTPLLSAGVEGTLIVLEALLVDASRLSNYEVTGIFSTALLRFLNLCAANSDRQGTFHKVALKNEVPKWLISLRHEIAHSHKVPSRSILELALKYCLLEWLKEKYWDVQLDCMADYVAESPNRDQLENAIYVFVQLTSMAHHKPESPQLGEELNERMGKLLRKNSSVDLKKALQVATSTLMNTVRLDHKQAIGQISKMLLDDAMILAINCEFDSFGKKKIPTIFVSTWTKLFNILHENKLLPVFVKKLFAYVCDESNTEQFKEIASLWIYEIYNGLLNIRKGFRCQEALQFRQIGNSLFPEDKEFVLEVLDKAPPYSLNFVREVLEFNNATKDLIEDSISIISACTVVSTAQNFDNIFTVEDFKLKMGDVDVNSNEQNPSRFRWRWRIIEDNLPFRSLPLGVLPGQPQSKNFSLDL